MIRLFDVEHGKIKPTVHCDLIPELKAVKDNYKDDYLKVYAYLFYVTYIGEENPYYNIEEEERSAIVLKDLDIKSSLQTDTIKLAIEKLKKLYETPTMRFYMAIKKTLDNLTNYLETSKITGGRDGNLDDVMKVMKEYDKLRQSFKNISNDLKEEQQVNARGGQKIAYDLNGTRRI